MHDQYQRVTLPNQRRRPMFGHEWLLPLQGEGWVFGSFPTCFLSVFELELLRNGEQLDSPASARFSKEDSPRCNVPHGN